MTTINFRCKFIVDEEGSFVVTAGCRERGRMLRYAMGAYRSGGFIRSLQQGYGLPSGSSPSQGSGRSEWSGRSSGRFSSSIS